MLLEFIIVAVPKNSDTSIFTLLNTLFFIAFSEKIFDAFNVLPTS